MSLHCPSHLRPFSSPQLLSAPLPAPRILLRAKPLCYLPLPPDLTTCCRAQSSLCVVWQLSSSCPLEASRGEGSHPNCSLTQWGGPGPEPGAGKGEVTGALSRDPSPVCVPHCIELAGPGGERSLETGVRALHDRPSDLRRLSVGTVRGAGLVSLPSVSARRILLGILHVRPGRVTVGQGQWVSGG